MDGHAALEQAAPDEAALAGAARGAGEVEEVEALLPLVHVFTHYKLHIVPYRVGLARRGETPAGHVWWKLASIGEAALPAPVKKLLMQLAEPGLFS